MTALQQAIWDFLGKFDKPVHRKELHTHLLNEGFVLSDSNMRGEIQAMKESGILLGATHRGRWSGYFIIRNLDQAALAVEELRTKAHTELNIANKLEKKATESFGGQAKLFQIMEAFK